MYLWLFSNPDITHEVVVGRGLRAEAMSRTSYVAMSRLADLVRHVVRGVVRLPGAAWRTLVRRQRRRRAMAELGALNDRALKDIGVSRGEIYARVEEVMVAEDRRRQAEAARATVAVPVTARPKPSIADLLQEAEPAARPARLRAAA